MFRYKGKMPYPIPEGMIFTKEEGIATLTLNRPGKLNAITSEMADMLADLAILIDRDDEVKVLIITGSDPGFCSGADMNIPDLVEGEGHLMNFVCPRRHPLTKPRETCWYALRNMSKPVLAAVNGIAAGAGFTIALECDIRIASENARFGTICIRRGMGWDAGLAYYLPRIVGASKAFELYLSGEIFDAKEAERLGIVSKVVSHNQLMKVTRELATKIANGPSIAIGLAKRLTYQGLEKDLETVAELETHSQRICNQTYDVREGIKSFLEKREPIFKGK
jgi:2-(1,2-epoxy-1,2-dihydrophenyl)acetyl-CoA isomerase